MNTESFYLVDVETGEVLDRWPCGHLDLPGRQELGARLRRELGVDDPDRGLDLRNTHTDGLAPWD